MLIKKHGRRIIALALLFAMIFTTISPSAIYAFEALENGQLVPIVGEGEGFFLDEPEGDYEPPPEELGEIIDGIDGDEEGEKGIEAEISDFNSVGLFGESVEYIWQADATNVDLSGITEITVKEGAIGKLRLVEESVSIDVDEVKDYLDSEIIAGVNTTHIILSAASATEYDYPKFKSLNSEGSENLTLNLDGTAFGIGTLSLNGGNISLSSSGGRLNLDRITGDINTLKTSGANNISGSIEANINTFTVESGIINIYDGILGNLKTLNVKGNLIIYTQLTNPSGDNPDTEAANPGIKSVKNININSFGSLFVSCGNNNVSGTETPNAINLDDGGKIDINNGNLDAYGSSGEYGNNPGGAGIYAQGNGEMVVSNGNVLANGGSSTSSNTGGVGLKAKGDFTLKLNGSNQGNNRLISLKGAYYSPATFGNISAEFNIREGEPTLELINGKDYTEESSSVNIKGNFPGVFEIEEDKFDINGDPNGGQSFSVKPTSGDGINNGGGRISFLRPVSNNLYIYAADEYGSPKAGVEYIVSKSGESQSKPITTGANGRAMFPFSEDEEYTISYGASQSFSVEIIDSLYTAQSLPAGISIIDSGNGLQFLPNGEEINITTITQIGGTSGQKNSEGILLTFNKGIDSLPSGAALADGITFGTPTDNGDSDNKTWYLPITDISSISNGESVEIKISNWGKYKVANTASVALYTRGEETSFTAEQFGGARGLVDTTNIILTFSEDIVGLTADKITLTGDGVSITNVNEQNAKTWLISLNISGTSTAMTQNITLKINDFASYMFPTEPTQVEIFRSVTRKVTYRAEAIGGVSGLANTTAIKLSFNLIVNGLNSAAIVLKDSEGVELTEIVKGQVKHEIEGGQEVYSLPISGSFENEQEITVDIEAWEGDVHYTIADGQTAQKVTLYRDTREELNFSLEQVGGISNQLKTQYIKITFNKPVVGLKLSNISTNPGAIDLALEPINPDENNKSEVWKLTAVNYGVGDSQEFTLTINDFDDYKLDDNNRIQKVVVYNSTFTDNSFYLEQRGGVNGLVDTESIAINFRLGVNLTLDNIQIEGATKGSLTKVGEDGRSWLLNVSDIKNNDKNVKITIEETDENLWLSTWQKEVRVYKDIRYYVDYKFEEVGGIDGEKNTEAFKISFTDKDGNPLTKEIEYLYLRNVNWGGAQLSSPQKVEGESNTWILPVAHFHWVKNGDTITMELEDIRVKGEVLELIQPKKEATIYKDSRVRLVLFASAFDGKKGTETTKYIRFGAEELTFEDFNISDFEIEGANLVRLVKPQGQIFGSGPILLEIDNIDDADNDGEAEIKLTVVNQPKGYVIRSLNEEQTVKVYKDLRKHLTYEIVEVGGEKDRETTNFIKLLFSEEIEYSDFYRGIITNALNDRLITYDMPMTIEADKKTLNIEIKAIGNFENGDEAFLEMMPSKAGNVVIDTENQKFTLHKKVISIGKSIETVSPSIIYNGSKQKMITLIGYFGTDGAKGVKSIILRDKNNTSNATEIVLDHYGKTYGGQATLRQKLDIDLSNLQMLNTVGEYEIAFRGNDGYFSDYVLLRVSDDEMYSTDAYGIVAVTQRGDRTFVVESFPSEALMNANKSPGTTLATIRGNISRAGDSFLIKGDSVLNKAIDYIPSSDSGILIQPNSGGLSIKADKGQLKWNGIVISDKGFNINLSNSDQYRNKRTSNNGKDVELIGSLQDLNFDAFAFSVNVGSYKLYEDEFSMTGRIGIGEALPNFLGDAGAYIELEEMLLQNRGLNIPPMKANGNIGFSPSEIFGDFVGASGGLGLELNTLPEEAYNYLQGEAELDISDVIYLQGEFVFAWGKRNGKMYFTPDTLKFFGRVGEGGVPLVPPIVVAYINGIGGGVSGIADVVSKNYGRIPPLEISVSGAISDVTGFIASVDKATLTIGPKVFSAKADEMTILKIVKLIDVGIAMGLDENETDDRFLDAYFEAGGHLDILNGTITGGLEIAARLYGYQLGEAIKAYMADVNKNGFKAPNAEVGQLLYDAFDVEGEIYAGVHGESFLGEIDAKGWLYANKILISGGVSGYIKPFWGSEYDGRVWVKYYFEDGKVELSNKSKIMLASTNTLSLGLPDEDYILAQGDEGELMMITNIENLGTFYPAGQGFRQRAIMGAEEVRGTIIPGLKKGSIVVIQSETEHLHIEIYKDDETEPYHLMITDEWADANYDYPELDGKGKYLVQYQIPEDGDYRFSAEGDLVCTAAVLVDMPQFENISLDKDNNKVTWTLNQTANDQINNLYVRLNIIDAQTGRIVGNLTAEGLSAYENEFTYALPGSLESGNYYLSAKLFEKDSDEEIVFDVAHTEEFQHIGTSTVGTVSGIRTDYSGNGVFNVSWNKIDEADGYLITILDTYGNKVPGIAQINVKAKDENGEDVLSTEILAGLFTLTDEKTNEETVQGIEFDKDYKISVTAYKNKIYTFGDDEHPIPVYGEPGYGALRVAEPTIPELMVYATGANEVVEEDGGTVYYANNPSPKFELDFDMDIDKLTVTHKGEGIPLTDNTLVYNYPEDGSYSFEITAEKGKDKGYYILNVVIDTKPPVLQIDQDSFIAYNNKIAINGYTEAGAEVLSSMGQVETQGTMFTVSGQIEGDNAALILSATDRAGNFTERILTLVYEEKEEPKPEPKPDRDRTDSDIVNEPAKVPVDIESFTDIGSHWAREDIAFVMNRGLFVGTSATTFSPDAEMTRGMFVTVMGRLANADVSSYKESSFADVNRDIYYMSYIEWASKNGIVNGIGDNKFDPDRPMTREQMAVIMQNYAKAMGFTLPEVHAANSFADDMNISNYAKEAVKQMQMAGIIKGKGDNLFDPQGTATRAEISAVLRRFIELMISDSGDNLKVPEQ